MARATFVRKARKDVAGTDIKTGESYYWWKFRFGGKHYSKTPPRRSQLTQSSFYASLWDIEDFLGEIAPDDGMESAVQDAAQQLRDLADECQSSLDNIPEQLQEANTGQILQERIEACNAAADELESITFNLDDKEEDETEEDFWQSKIDEVNAITVDAP